MERAKSGKHTDSVCLTIVYKRQTELTPLSKLLEPFVFVSLSERMQYPRYIYRPVHACIIRIADNLFLIEAIINYYR